MHGRELNGHFGYVASPLNEETGRYTVTIPALGCSVALKAANLWPAPVQKPPKKELTSQPPKPPSALEVAAAATPPPQPTKLDTKPRHAVTSWEHVATSMALPTPLSSTQQAQLSFAATLAHGLAIAPVRTSNKLTYDPGKNYEKPAYRTAHRTIIWIVGATEAAEGELARSGLLAEPLSQLCPELGRLELYLIGPEMREWSLNPNDALEVHGVPGLMHRVSQHGKLSSGWPDFAVLFDSGLGTTDFAKVDPWLGTLTMLIQTNAAILLTCRNKAEAGLMTQLLAGPYRAVVTVGARANALITEQMVREDGHPAGHAWMMWIQGTDSRSTLQGAIARAEAHVKGLAGQGAEEGLV